MKYNHTAKIGAPMHMCVGSDRYPYTVVAIKGASIYLAQTEYRRTDNNGLSESQSYEFFPPGADTPLSSCRRAMLQSNGKYKIKGKYQPWVYTGWAAYQDPSY